MSIELNRRVGALERLVNRLMIAGGTGIPGGMSARVYNNANISINDITDTAVTFNTENYDDAAFHSTSVNPSRLTVPHDGVYVMMGGIQWDGVNVGRRTIWIAVNGTKIAHVRAVSLTGDDYYMVVSAMYEMTAGQYAELYVLHNRGSALDIEADGDFGIWFSIARVR